MTVLFASLPLAAFVLWLVSFPMSGFLLPSDDSVELMVFFLLPHALTMPLLATTPLPPTSRTALFRLSGGLTIMLTVVFPQLVEHATLLLFLLGIGAAPLAVGVVVNLRHSPDPAWSAALGLLTGNLLAAMLWHLPLPSVWLFLLIALPLLLSMPLVGAHSTADTADCLHRPKAGLFPPFLGRLLPYLPFILLFYLIGGLMFGHITPQYLAISRWPGIELFCYGIATLGGAWLIKRNRDFILALGILWGMLSFALLTGQLPITVILSMYANHMAFGLVDLFLIYLLINQPDPHRATAIGLPVMLAAILLGALVGDHFTTASQQVIGGGNLVLTMAILALYILGWWRSDADQETADPTHTEPATEAENALAAWESVQKPCHKQLSEQERAVVSLILAGQTFKEAATQLQISESSVKTYMRRIYEKTGTSGKTALLNLLTNPPETGEYQPSKH